MDVAWGWSPEDLEGLAGYTARTHYSAFLPYEERQAIAYHELIVAILEARTRPDPEELLHAARDAISAATRGEYRARGLSSRDKARASERFVTYWYAAPRLNSPYEDTVLDRIAVAQIWTVLLPSHRRVLEALAEHGTYQAAARALDTTDATFKVRVSKARAAFRAWWHEHEEPSKMWGSDRRVTPARNRPVTRVMKTRTRDRVTATQEGAAA